MKHSTYVDDHGNLCRRFACVLWIHAQARCEHRCTHIRSFAHVHTMYVFILSASRIPPSPLHASRLCNDLPCEERRCLRIYVQSICALYDTVVAHSAWATSVPIKMPNTNTLTLGHCGCAKCLQMLLKSIRTLYDIMVSHSVCSTLVV